MASYKINFPQLGTFTLVSVWQKGKKGKDLRYEVSNGKESFLVWLATSRCFAPKLELEFVDLQYCKVISPTQMKNQCYNYYLVGPATEQEFDNLIAQYEGSNPMVPVTLTSMMHGEYSHANYKLIEKI